jgi:hypothetical protein
LVSAAPPVSGSGSTVAVSVMPVGSGTVGLLPMKGYPSPPAAAAVGGAGAAAPSVGCSGKPKCGAVVCVGGRWSAPAVGGGAGSGGRPGADEAPPSSCRRPGRHCDGTARAGWSESSAARRSAAMLKASKQARKKEIHVVC